MKQLTLGNFNLMYLQVQNLDKSFIFENSEILPPSSSAGQVTFKRTSDNGQQTTDTGMDTDRDTDAIRDTDIDRDTDKDRDTDTHRDTDTYRDVDTDRDRNTDWVMDHGHGHGQL